MDLLELVVKLVFDSKEYTKGLDETEDKAKQTQSKLANIFGKIATITANAVVAATTAAATGISAMLKQSVSAYGEYEQLVGGIETIFGNSTNVILKNAQNAYKTAQISTNDYLNTVMSFSASLLQGLAQTDSQMGKITKSELSDMLEEQLEQQEKSYNKQYDIASKSYDKQYDTLEKTLDSEIEAYEEATNKKIELINSEYIERIKLIDEEKYKRLKAVDDKIEALNEEAEAESYANKKKEYESKRAEALEAARNAENATERKKALAEISKLDESWNQSEKDRKRKEKIESLRDEKESIKNDYDQRKKALQDEQTQRINTIKETENKQLKVMRESRDEQLKTLRETNQEKLKILKEGFDEELKDAKKAAKQQIEAFQEGGNSAEYTTEQVLEAAKISDRAIQDMADNANKYGTSMSYVMQTYQSLAGGNYQLLDNLKLGYSGTKSEMERLVKDAAGFIDIQKELGITVDANSLSFNNIINAISIMQYKLGISGTATKEASETIQGSVGSMKAAWDNLIIALSAKPEDNLDIDTYIDNFIASAEGAISNLEPTIERALTGVGTLIEKFAPKAVDKISGLINQILPSLIKSATSLVVSIIKMLSNKKILTTILEAVKTIIQVVLPALAEVVPDLISTLVDVIGDLIVFLTENLSTFVKPIIEKLPEIVKSILNAVAKILDNLPELLDMVADIVTTIADTLIELIPILIESALKIYEKVIEYVLRPDILEKLVVMTAKIVIAIEAGLLASVPKLLTGIGKIISTCITNILSTDWEKLGQDMIDNITTALQNASDKLSEWWDGWSQEIGKYATIAWNSVVDTWTGVGQWFSDRWTDIKNAFSNVATWFSETFKNAWDEIKKVFAPVGDTFNSIGNSILDGVKSLINQLISGINYIIAEPFNGLNDALNNIKNTDIFGQKPFEWINGVTVPVIPQLAKGGILKKGQMAFLEGQGDEAVIPLSQNTEWIDKVASRLGSKEKTIQLNVTIDKFVNNTTEDIKNLAAQLADEFTAQISRQQEAFA